MARLLPITIFSSPLASPSELDTFIVILYSPFSLGEVPVIKPVSEFMANPAGRFSAVTLIGLSPVIGTVYKNSLPAVAPITFPPFILGVFGVSGVRIYASCFTLLLTGTGAISPLYSIYALAQST